MKKRAFMVLIVFLLALSLFSAAAEEPPKCGVLCQMGGWWSEFRGEESLVGEEL